MKKYLGMAVMACLTLGLAPYYPHAHIWKQLKKLWYGWNMEMMDWVDLLMHGAPWVFLIYVLVGMYRERKAKVVQKKS